MRVHRVNTNLDVRPSDASRGPEIVHGGSPSQYQSRYSLQKKCISATHICNASCVAETICNALCVAEFAMRKTGLQIFCNASQRSVAEICNAKAIAVWRDMPTI